MNRLTLLIIGAIALQLGALSTSAQAEVPACPRGTDLIITYPPAYVRAGEGVKVEMKSKNLRRAPGASVSVSGPDGDQQSVGFAATGRLLTLILGVIRGPGTSRTLTFSWTQDEGTPRACQGTDSYSLQVIPADASAGDPYSVRLDGRFRMLERGSGEVFRPTWRFTPGCDYFACDSRVRSTLTLGGKFRLQPNGTYELEQRRRSASACVLTKSRGGVVIGRKRIRRAFFENQRVVLRVVKSRAGRALTIAGRSSTEYEPTRHARRFGCEVSYLSESLFGRRA